MLLLLPALGRASVRGKGITIAKALELTGARNEKELREGLEALHELWVAPDESDGELPVALYEENGELYLTYAGPFGTLTAFSLAEGAVLLAALKPFEKDGAKPVKDAIRKLRRAIPEILQEEADALAGGLDVAIAPPEPWAGVLNEAIARRLETVLEYRAVADDRVESRTVEPRTLFQRDGKWYLAAWNAARGEEHLYRLDRIATVVPGTRVFGGHKGPPTSRYAKNLFFASGQERDVTIRHSGSSALEVRQRKRARLHEEAGGTVTVTSRNNPGNYLFGLLLGSGGEAAVAGPADVVEAFEKRLGELEGLYESTLLPDRFSTRALAARLPLA
jgi:proteasome accessory factor C